MDKDAPDIRKFATGVSGGAPIGEQLRARGVAAESVIDELARLYESAFGKPGRMPLRAIVFEARKP